MTHQCGHLRDRSVMGSAWEEQTGTVALGVLSELG